MDNNLMQRLNYFLYSIAIACGLIVVGICVSGKIDNGSVTAFLTAYIALGVIICIKTALMGSNMNFDGLPLMSKIVNFMMTFFPLLSLLVVILWIVIIIFKYYDRITQGHVSDYYTSFMNIASILIIIQIYMIFSETSDKQPTLSPRTSSILRLLSVLSSLSVITVAIVLKFYVTDC